jgi:hypothetical protein
LDNELNGFRKVLQINHFIKPHPQISMLFLQPGRPGVIFSLQGFYKDILVPGGATVESGNAGTMKTILFPGN